MKIYLIRHGQTEWNVDGKIQGEWVKVHEIQKKEKLLAAGYL